MPDGSFVKAVADLARPTTVEVDQRSYSTVPLTPIADPTALPLRFCSLTGFVDYILAGPDSKIAQANAVHVESAQMVQLISPVAGAFRKRESLAFAEPPAGRFKFEMFLPQEQFVIALQALFVQTPVRDQVLGLVSSMTAEEIRTQSDNGIAQEVTARAGTHLLDRVTLPNPVILAPYRTFREVKQPESAFILRARKGAGGVLELALFEADGGAWELAAMDNVAARLRAKLPNFQVLA